MTGFYTHIENDTLKNDFFRKVLFTGKYTQLVIMSLKPNEEIGFEVHKTVDQFFRFEKGEGRVIIEGQEYIVNNGDVVIVPAGSNHNVINTSNNESLKLYTLYSPPNHPENTIHKTKEEAQSSEK